MHRALGFVLNSAGFFLEREGFPEFGWIGGSAMTSPMMRVGASTRECNRLMDLERVGSQWGDMGAALVLV